MTFHRYVALGDSFTEGVGDNDPTRPNGLRGWADRTAEVLAAQTPDFGYANLAIRGRKLPAILADQLEPALALAPDLITIHGGGNDVLRPKVDIDAICADYAAGIARLKASGATVAIFSLFDPGPGGIYGAVRGRMALFNEHVREIADTQSVLLVDMWRMRGFDMPVVMDDDRMHLNHLGHSYLAGQVLKVLGVPDPRPPLVIPEREVLAKKDQRAEDLRWTKEFLGPWVKRRVTGKSSGDSVSPKRPTLAPIAPVDLTEGASA